MGVRVAVVGARGRMGSLVCRTVDAADDLELVAEIDASDGLEGVVEAEAAVAVEFSTPRTVHPNTAWLLDRGIHTVVGATGLTSAQLDDLRRRTGTAHCLVAANFAIGAVLLMQLAEKVAGHLEWVEITELHHERKLDAPSGTALVTAERIAAARRAAGRQAPDAPGTDEAARGLRVEGIPVHAVRLPGIVAAQEVRFGAEGQTLTLRHDTTDRTAFMPGVLLAIRDIARHPGLTVGLDAYL